MTELIKRYWFILDPTFRFGTRNIGVSAYSLDHAKSIIVQNIHNISWLKLRENLIDDCEVIENIDVTLLDQNHVLPNIGAVCFLGIWHPQLNI